MFKKKKQAEFELLVEKLRQIVLGIAPLHEIGSGEAALFELWRQLRRGEITLGEYAERGEPIVDAVTQSKPTMIWEPLSDGAGDLLRHYGWAIYATIYLLNGQTWWFVRARHNRVETEPTEIEIKHLEKVLPLLGCVDVERDTLHVMHGPHDPQERYYSWFHHGPLLEEHWSKDAIIFVPEGTPIAPSFKRVPRLDIDRLPDAPPGASTTDYRVRAHDDDEQPN